MIVDSSAIVAILKGESEAADFVALLLEDDGPRMSGANYVEAGVVADSGKDAVLSRQFDSLLQELQVSIEPVSAQQAIMARQAYRDFGKGSGHPANLNFGDCFAYALASETGQPLLFKGDDFTQTNITAAA